MIRGLYTGASGMMSDMERVNVTANNLANVNTTGYKKDIMLSGDFASLLVERIDDQKRPPAEVGPLGTGVLPSAIVPIHSQGAIQSTGRYLDVAIQGRGFFVLETPNGYRYTRDGSFTVNTAGELVNQQGYRVLGDGGVPLVINADQPNVRVSIADDGTIYVHNNGVEQAANIDVSPGRLWVVEFENVRQLEKEGGNLWRNTDDTVLPLPASGTVKQGVLEMSNVNVVSEMVNLIAANRSYEMSSKVITTEDSLLNKIINEVARF
ncbi:MAG: flagellar basal-body rod protein FlgF [Negativicutes bacterium]|nr:flagellar basal-body rod protein FlgF [Negativicutes bacterium]